MWPHEYVVTLLWFATASWGLVLIVSALVIWDFTRTEPTPPGYDPLRSRVRSAEW
jgi:hypothetical protein